MTFSADPIVEMELGIGTMIERHRRRLANGEERVYTYGVGADGERQSLSIRSVDDSLSICQFVGGGGSWCGKDLFSGAGN